ncbi:MAG TPA: patatin-like phospholipase family protein [Steroidobacteraceae bacterium]|nr:patatin-like phospholipase family protein [Steroidobacteraceae bacterium]
MRLVLRVAAGSAALLLLAGCASLGPTLPMSAADEAPSEELSFGVRTLGADGEFELLSSRELARRLRSQIGDRPLSMLALSSGGASGAFGAGALAGATRGGARPEFTVVTGVSTGALVAPFAFLGPSSDAEMTQIFTTGATDGLLRHRGFTALFGSSVYSGEPLRRLIDRYADNAMIAAIAVQAARGRLLLVATTDLSSGEPVVWDLGSIALHGGKNAKPLIRKVLLASASVPGMLPPVVVRFRSRGQMREETHVDGGVTLPFFIAPMPQDLPQSTRAGAQTTVVRVIIDGPLRNLPSPTRDNAFSVFRRSISAGLSHMTRTQLEATVEEMRQRGIALDYAAIPVSYPLRGSFDFSPDGERSLFEYAERCAAAGRLWIGVHAESGAGVSSLLPPTASPMCPADDAYFERLASLWD